ncbi:hypothetical protein WAI453_000291 [Rhynchosporium graminicola]
MVSDWRAPRAAWSSEQLEYPSCQSIQYKNPGHRRENMKALNQESVWVVKIHSSASLCGILEAQSASHHSSALSIPSATGPTDFSIEPCVDQLEFTLPSSSISYLIVYSHVKVSVSVQQKCTAPTPQSDPDKGHLPLALNAAGENRGVTRPKIGRATTARDDIRPSPPPSSRNVDVLDSPLKAQDTTRGNDVSSTAYIQTTQSTLGDIPIASTSDSNHNTIPYNTSNTDHRQYQDGAPASNTPYIATPVSYTADSGFYQDQTDYSVSGSPQGSHSGYYPIAGQQRNDWLATTGNSSTFLGAISEYYYIEPTPENQVYQRR